VFSVADTDNGLPTLTSAALAPAGRATSANAARRPAAKRRCGRDTRASDALLMVMFL
jgi:hypothetical protein